MRVDFSLLHGCCLVLVNGYDYFGGYDSMITVIIMISMMHEFCSMKFKVMVNLD